MDQLRHLMYNPPTKPHPWDPTRPRANGESTINPTATPLPGSVPAPFPGKRSSTDSKSSNDSLDSASPKKDLAHELELVLNRGHPNIVKLLDFFEDREFYYCKSIQLVQNRVVLMTQV
jgi:protein-serine/threonine kinase